MFRLPDYEVVVQILYNDFGKKLENEILSEAASYELDESTEYQGANYTSNFADQLGIRVS